MSINRGAVDVLGGLSALIDDECMDSCMVLVQIRDVVAELIGAASDGRHQPYKRTTTARADDVGIHFSPAKARRLLAALRNCGVA